jgi:hypothetical protein
MVVVVALGWVAFVCVGVVVVDSSCRWSTTGPGVVGVCVWVLVRVPYRHSVVGRPWSGARVGCSGRESGVVGASRVYVFSRTRGDGPGVASASATGDGAGGGRGSMALGDKLCGVVVGVGRPVSV